MSEICNLNFDMTKTHGYPNPWDLHYFREVASTQNLSRAAEQLGVSQSALSLSLKRLEEGLEVELFSRRNRGLEVTSAGRRLLRECDSLLANWNAVVAEAKKSETELKGRFRIGCHPAVGLYTLDPFLRDLHRDFLGIEVELVHGLSRAVCQRVVAGHIEFGFVVNPSKHPELVISRLGYDDVCFWKAKDGCDDVLLLAPELKQSDTLMSGIQSNRFRRQIPSDSLELLAVLARSGTGVVILPTRVVKALAPTLERVDGLPTFRDEITVVHRADLRKTAAAKVLLERLKRIQI